MTGPEMMLSTLIKLFKLEPEVEKIRVMIKQAAEENLLEQAKEALETVRGFDGRLTRIEQRLNIEPIDGYRVTSGTSPLIVRGETRYDFDLASQSRNGTDSG